MPQPRLVSFMKDPAFLKKVRPLMRDLRIASEADLRWRTAAYLESRISRDTTIKNWRVNTEMGWTLADGLIRPDLVVHHNNEVKGAFELKVFPRGINHSDLSEDVRKLNALQGIARNGFLVYLHREDESLYVPRAAAQDFLEVVPVSIPIDVMDKYRARWSFQQFS